MSFKEAIEKELNINSKISFEEASLRITNLKEKTFNNVKTEWKKDQIKLLKKVGNSGKNPRKNSRNKNATNNNLEKGLDDFTTLNSESLEKLLVTALRKQPDNANLIGKAIDFFLKVKGSVEDIKNDVDMEALLKAGILVSEEGSNMEEYEENEPYPLQLE